MPVLSSNSQTLLLALARQTIQHYLQTRTLVSFQPSCEEILMPRGCFITLRKHKILRGCVGTFDPHPPLFENVMRMAIASAFEDFRFPSVTEPELEEIQIEISVLGEPCKMNSIEELEIGKHGIWVRYGHRSGAFLPEVAAEQGWSREEFLRHCALEKAGISSEEFLRAEFFIYEVQKFSEKE